MHWTDGQTVEGGSGALPPFPLDDEEPEPVREPEPVLEPEPEPVLEPEPVSEQ